MVASFLSVLFSASFFFLLLSFFFNLMKTLSQVSKALVYFSHRLLSIGEYIFQVFFLKCMSCYSVYLSKASVDARTVLPTSIILIVYRTFRYVPESCNGKHLSTLPRQLRNFPDSSLMPKCLWIFTCTGSTLISHVSGLYLIRNIVLEAVCRNSSTPRKQSHGLASATLLLLAFPCEN